MLLTNNKYTLTINLGPSSVELQFLSTLDPCYVEYDTFVDELGVFAEGADPVDIGIELLRASRRADEVLGVGALDEDRETYATLRAKVAFLEDAYERHLAQPESLRLADFTVSYSNPASLLRLLRNAKAQLSRYEGIGSVTSVSKGEEREYPLGTRW